MQMQKLNKVLIRFVFFLLVFGGFLGQSFASIFVPKEQPSTKKIEFRSPEKKSSLCSSFIFNTEEELGEAEEDLDDDESKENFPPSYFSLPSGTTFFYFETKDFIQCSKFTSVEETPIILFFRPFYDQFHQWKIDLI
jgi:hypothetical protein